MVLYNTLSGMLAGLLLFYAAVIVRRAYTALDSLKPYGVGLLMAGIPLTAISAVGMFTEPLTANQPFNIAIWQPSLLLGIMAITGGILIVRGADLTTYLPLLAPVVASGVAMLLISAAIFRFNLIGDAPPFEPITGQSTGWENPAFGIVYAMIGIGAIATPWAKTPQVARVIFWLWLIAAAALTLFSVLNFYTHIGMEVNLIRFGTDHPDQWYRW